MSIIAVVGLGHVGLPLAVEFGKQWRAMELREYGIDVHVHDSIADAADARREYDLELEDWESLPKAVAMIATVAHEETLARLLSDLTAKVAVNGCFIDVKSRHDQIALRNAGLSVWRL